MIRYDRFRTTLRLGGCGKKLRILNSSHLKKCAGFQVQTRLFITTTTHLLLPRRLKKTLGFSITSLIILPVTIQAPPIFGASHRNVSVPHFGNQSTLWVFWCRGSGWDIRSFTRPCVSEQNTKTIRFFNRLPSWKHISSKRIIGDTGRPSYVRCCHSRFDVKTTQNSLKGNDHGKNMMPQIIKFSL